MGSTIFLIGFALVHFICVITLVVWLSHSICLRAGVLFCYPISAEVGSRDWCVLLLIDTIITVVADSTGFR